MNLEFIFVKQWKPTIVIDGCGYYKFDLFALSWHKNEYWFSLYLVVLGFEFSIQRPSDKTLKLLKSA